MKEQFAKDVMKLAIQNKILITEDPFLTESLKKIAMETKIPVKLSGITAGVFSMIFSLGNTKSLEVNNG